VWNFLADAATRWPNRCAVRQGDGNDDLTYQNVAVRALAIAGHLRARGVQPGDRVGCLMLNGVDHMLSYFAVAAAGAIFVSLNTRLTANEQRAILSHSGSTLLLHDLDHSTRAAELQVASTLADDGDSGDFTPTPADREQPAQLYYTSGTTGSPKGVVLSHENVCTHALAACAELQLSADDTWAHIAPMFHLADAWATFAITAVHGTHVFLPHFTAGAALELLERERVTITNLVPTMLNLMVAAPDAAGRRYALRAMLSGGAPIAPDVVRAILATFRCDYVQTYGMTETSPYLTLSL